MKLFLKNLLLVTYYIGGIFILSFSIISPFTYGSGEISWQAYTILYILALAVMGSCRSMEILRKEVEEDYKNKGV